MIPLVFALQFFTTGRIESMNDSRTGADLGNKYLGGLAPRHLGGNNG